MDCLGRLRQRGPAETRACVCRSTWPGPGRGRTEPWHSPGTRGRTHLRQLPPGCHTPPTGNFPLACPAAPRRPARVRRLLPSPGAAIKHEGRPRRRGRSGEAGIYVYVRARGAAAAATVACGGAPGGEEGPRGRPHAATVAAPLPSRAPNLLILPHPRWHFPPPTPTEHFPAPRPFMACNKASASTGAPMYSRPSRPREHAREVLSLHLSEGCTHEHTSPEYGHGRACVYEGKRRNAHT